MPEIHVIDAEAAEAAGAAGAAAFDEADQAPASPAGAPGSAITRLRASIAARRSDGAGRLDLLVPGLPGIFVRFARADEKALAAIRARTEKLPAAISQRTFAMQLIARVCTGIGVVDDAGAKTSLDEEDPEGPWPRFDARLAEILGVEASAAAQLVAALYGSDGAMIATAARINTWSGYDDEAVEEALGEA